VWVLSSAPFIVLRYREAYCRLSTRAYNLDSSKGVLDRMTHLTNVAVQGQHEDCIWGLEQLEAYLAENSAPMDGSYIENLQDAMRRIMRITMSSAELYLSPRQGVQWVGSPRITFPVVANRKFPTRVHV